MKCVISWHGRYVCGAPQAFAPVLTSDFKEAWEFPSFEVAQGWLDKYYGGPEGELHNIPGDTEIKIIPRFPRPVVCAWCNNKHSIVLPIQLPDNFVADTHGRFCSGSVWLDRDTWYVKCYYGSEYDNFQFRFLKNVPQTPTEPVCDNCVGERLVVGDLEEIIG